MAERASGRKNRERRAEALHPSAFLVDSHQEGWVANRMDIIDERAQLVEVLKVAREQNHAADDGRSEPFALIGRERRPAQTDHQGTERHALSFS